MTTDAPLGMARDQFLARIRAALEGNAPEPPEMVGDVRSLARLLGPGAGLVDHFSRGATTVGMNVHPCQAQQLGDALGSLLRTLGARSAALSCDDAELLGTARGVLRAGPLAEIDWRGSPGYDALFEADVGITDVFAALAETGTLVVRSSPATTRGGFLVAPVHVALLRASRILPDMVDLWPLLGGRTPTSIVLITGPSKTADIEGILITGVHGPKEVHIVLIEDA